MGAATVPARLAADYACGGAIEVASRGSDQGATLSSGVGLRITRHAARTQTPSDQDAGSSPLTRKLPTQQMSPPRVASPNSHDSPACGQAQAGCQFCLGADASSVGMDRQR
jgi:hypothetical protein